MTVSKTYKVVAGDTLTSIAKKYSTTVRDLKSLNNLSSDLIKVGQILKIQADSEKVSVNNKKAIIFFIGGAGDKESFYGAGPYGNIAEVHVEFAKRVNLELTSLKQRIIFDRNISYLGYNEVYGSVGIQKNIINVIKNKGVNFIYIVGHSLGAWNGAHLTTELKKAGYSVEMLITLDPVGEGVIVSNFSDIAYSKPVVSAKTWINIRCDPDTKNKGDYIADFGEQWKPVKGFTYNVITKFNHANALGIMRTVVIKRQTAMDLLLESIKENLQ